MKMIIFFVLFLVMEHQWNEIDGKTEVLWGGGAVAVPLSPPQIPRGLTRDRSCWFILLGMLISMHNMWGRLMGHIGDEI
jgi:hypothetical protein